MGIYIKDLNMPNTCSECREIGLAHVEGIICDQDTPGDTPYNMCPLKEINLDDLIGKMIEEEAKETCAKCQEFCCDECVYKDWRE